MFLKSYFITPNKHEIRLCNVIKCLFGPKANGCVRNRFLILEVEDKNIKINCFIISVL